MPWSISEVCAKHEGEAYAFAWVLILKSCARNAHILSLPIANSRKKDIYNFFISIALTLKINYNTNNPLTIRHRTNIEKLRLCRSKLGSTLPKYERSFLRDKSQSGSLYLHFRPIKSWSSVNLGLNQSIILSSKPSFKIAMLIILNSKNRLSWNAIKM